MNLLLDAIRRHPAYLGSRPFYRLHPTASDLRLSWRDARGAVDFDTGAFYNRVPKAANSFILLELFKLKSVDAMPRQVAKKRYLRPSELDEAGARRFDRLFKFTFVRNPYSRTLSAYLNKVQHKGTIIRSIARDRVPTFAEFCGYLADGGLYNNIHWAPQASIMLLPVDGYDYVGRVENMDVDLPAVMRRLVDVTGRTRPEDFAARTGQPGTFHAPNADDKVARMYDAKSRDIVTRLFADDLRLFGYPQL